MQQLSQLIRLYSQFTPFGICCYDDDSLASSLAVRVIFILFNCLHYLISAEAQLYLLNFLSLFMY